MIFTINVNEKEDAAVLNSDEKEKISSSLLFKKFKYIKTFTPMRRFTTSHAGTVKFMLTGIANMSDDEKIKHVLPDVISERVLNRSFMRDPDDRLYRDSIIVRFEDGKLNPKATLTKLAAFLDIPYTESMTYCSDKGELNPVGLNEAQAVGFSSKAVYRTYDEYINDNERRYLEYFLRDAYLFYGYNFQWYDGSFVNEEVVNSWIDGFTTLDEWIRETWIKAGQLSLQIVYEGDEQDAAVNKVEIKKDSVFKQYAENNIITIRENRKEIARILLRGLRFVNKRGQPLEFTPMLQPDPDLLDQPLYH